MRKAASVIDYRELARRRLPKFLFEYIDGGSYAEVTLKRNIADLEAVVLRQRVLRDVSKIDLSTEILGQRLAMPVSLGPVGLSGMYARRGEVQAARAAQAAGVQFTLSTVGCCSLQEVSKGAGKPIWFQLYIVKDRGFMREMMAIARELLCPILFFTVDLPLPGSRYRDVHSGLAGAPGLRGQLRRFVQGATRPDWAWDVGINGRPHNLGNVAPLLGAGASMLDFLAWMGGNFDATLTWKDLDWIRAEWPGKFVIKGILDEDDAREAARAGVDGIVVSNHGGRQLDGVLSSARALPRIADAVAGELTILADGGVRSGLDVLRMLALGADGVLLGRAWAYALAARGEAGVAHMLKLIEAEMRVAMALTGCTRIAEIDRAALADVPG
ncbi:FMN-dependent L-lactate dehydrogenase LldD [Sphingomonas sp.]|uniref:FMN-dependent L-lactate dehydrogenase LldD n=1 Tax=Sphingomonas sp. TaxID=28214 RepID=UPI001B1F1F73|nr:FMN-dependent L-lactate dehydrogenase LldD [Sphingomonas sp.]MBO9712218.1 FMN-dependent L-lactate dehydrogenase LldD [Sphingomonas sp.]